MKKKFVIPMSLVMTAALSIPLCVSAENAAANPSTTTINSTTVSNDKSGSTTTTPTAPASLSLSLEEALSRVEKGYSQVILDDRYIEILDRQYQQARGYAKNMNGNKGPTIQENDMKVLKYNEPVALFNLNNKKHQRDIDFKNAKVNITNEYQSVLAAQMNIDYIKEQVSNLQKDMDLINSRIKVGTAKASDIETDKAAMAKLEASISIAQTTMDSALISLKNDLGIDLNTKVTLTSKPLNYVKYDGTKIDEKIQNAIKNSFSIKSLQQDIENTKILYTIHKQYFDSQENSTEISIGDKQNQLNLMPSSIEVQLRVQYNTLKSKEDTVEADKLSIEAAQINYDTLQNKYNQGLVTYLDVLNAHSQLSSAKNTLQQDIISYMTASTSFQNSLESQ